jgi:PPOX class probable F420-dependent enzyme
MALDAYADLLDAPNVAVLASRLPDGGIQASPVWFLYRDGEVLVSTTKDRQKHRNLVRDPHVAFALVDPDRSLRYLEIRGTARVADDADLAVRDAIARKHGYADGAALDRPGAERVVITLVPDRVIER